MDWRISGKNDDRKLLKTPFSCLHVDGENGTFLNDDFTASDLAPVKNIPLHLASVFKAYSVSSLILNFSLR